MSHYNLRSLRRTEEGFTLKPESLDLECRRLCNQCAYKQSCPVMQELNNQDNEFLMGTLVYACNYYMPPIEFQDPTGLEAGRNTLRLGHTWNGRLEKGDVVGLVNQDGETFARATVGKVICDEKFKVLESHSHRNHLFTGKRISKADAYRQMVMELPKMYGNMIWNNYQWATAIYFERVECLPPES